MSDLTHSDAYWCGRLSSCLEITVGLLESGSSKTSIELTLDVMKKTLAEYNAYIEGLRAKVLPVPTMVQE
jgi:hypothetical protein